MVNWVEDHTGVSGLWRGRFAVIEGFAAVESSDEEFLSLPASDPERQDPHNHCTVR
jgi:hypothetical protein